MSEMVDLDTEVTKAELDTAESTSSLKVAAYVGCSVIGVLIGVLGAHWLRGTSPDLWALVGSVGGIFFAAWIIARHMNTRSGGLKITVRLMAFCGLLIAVLGMIGFGVSPYAWQVLFIGMGLLALSSILWGYELKADNELRMSPKSGAENLE